MLEKLQKIIYLAIIFFISSQVGLHFWPQFAFVAGIRIDYLSPTLYLLDILIIALLLISIPRFSGLINLARSAKFPKIVFVLLILSLVWNIFYAKSQGAHIFGIIKLAEFAFFGYFAAKAFSKSYIRPFVLTVAASAILSSGLAVWQFLKQSSIGGPWYFLGERTFNISTIGISTVNLDHLVLRPYAAFPHPNVLAFFLLASIIFAVIRIPYEKSLLAKRFLVLTVIVSTISLFLTFSRIISLIAICFFFYAIYTKGKRNVLYIVPAFVIVFALLNYFILDFLTSQFLFRGINFRQELLFQFLDIILKNPYFGIGLNNFFVHQIDLIKNISPILFQPPHNIFVVALLSLGIFGWWIFPAMFIFAIRSIINRLRTNSKELRAFHGSVLLVLIAIMIVGMFDHFFLTLEQGQIMLALILGLSFAKLKG